MHDAHNNSINETYTVGERISNICLFSRHLKCNWFSLPKDIVTFIQLSGCKIANRLEYQNDNLTGNHIVNNARALIFAGHCAKIKTCITWSKYS